MQDAGDINMDDEVDKFCILLFTIRVAIVGTSAVVKAWNTHRIPFKCM